MSFNPLLLIPIVVVRPEATFVASKKVKKRRAITTTPPPSPEPEPPNAVRTGRARGTLTHELRVLRLGTDGGLVGVRQEWRALFARLVGRRRVAADRLVAGRRVRNGRARFVGRFGSISVVGLVDGRHIVLPFLQRKRKQI